MLTVGATWRAPQRNSSYKTAFSCALLKEMMVLYSPKISFLHHKIKLQIVLQRTVYHRFTHLSSTSWNTQFGVCVVVKIRLSGGILGAVEKRQIKSVCNSTNCFIECPYNLRESSDNVTEWGTVIQRDCRLYLHIQSAPFQPAGGSKTVLQPAQHPELSSGTESYEMGSTGDPLHAPFHH